MVNLVIISGLSGAGKTYTISNFEENGYSIVENIPVSLLPAFYDELSKDKGDKKVALSVPIFDAKKAYDLAKERKDFVITFVGLFCSKEALLERYKLSRRIHPLQHSGISLSEAIDKETEEMLKIKEEFSHFVDTSKLANGDLRKYLYTNIFTNKDAKLSVNFISFGYKKSVPQDVEIVFDVRLLPNPYWIPELKNLCGLDEPVKDYVFNSKETSEYLKHVIEYLDFYLPKLEESGRKSTTIGIACSGGQHRSVAISEYLKNYYSKRYNTSVNHRDLVR